MTDPLPRLVVALSDRYTIERELGAGGMATVYLAQDLKHDRQVALKVLKPELAAVLGAERFVATPPSGFHSPPPHSMGKRQGWVRCIRQWFERLGRRIKLLDLSPINMTLAGVFIA